MAGRGRGKGRRYQPRPPPRRQSLGQLLRAISEENFLGVDAQSWVADMWLVDGLSDAQKEEYLLQMVKMVRQHTGGGIRREADNWLRRAATALFSLGIRSRPWIRENVGLYTFHVQQPSRRREVDSTWTNRDIRLQHHPELAGPAITIKGEESVAEVPPGGDRSEATAPRTDLSPEIQLHVPEEERMELDDPEPSGPALGSPFLFRPPSSPTLPRPHLSPIHPPSPCPPVPLPLQTAAAGPPTLLPSSSKKSVEVKGRRHRQGKGAQARHLEKRRIQKGKRSRGLAPLAQGTTTPFSAPLTTTPLAPVTTRFPAPSSTVSSSEAAGTCPIPGCAGGSPLENHAFQVHLPGVFRGDLSLDRATLGARQQALLSAAGVLFHRPGTLEELLREISMQASTTLSETQVSASAHEAMLQFATYLGLSPSPV